MHIVKVNVTIDCSAFRSDCATGLATFLAEATHHVEISDEQYDYLCREEEALGIFDEADLWDLRPDFQQIADRLSKPYTGFIYQQLLDSGDHPANIERYLECMECSVRHERELCNDDDDIPDEFFNVDFYRQEREWRAMTDEAAEGHRLPSYDAIYRVVPQMLAARMEESARTVLTQMADESYSLDTPLGTVLVVRIPAYATPSGLIVEYLALARQSERLAYFTIENDEGLYFLDAIQPERHSTLGVQWATQPTMQQIAERIQEFMDTRK